MKIYNTLSEKKEALPRPNNRPVRLFVCGPTVYDYPHIGNARTFLVFDLFVRYLRNRGIRVYYIQNITDVDDKIIARANEQGVSWKDISMTYEKIYRSNLKALNATSITKHANATKYIKEIVRQVQALIKKGYVYEIASDGLYFDLSKFPEYGKLAHRTVAQANDAVSRIDTSDKKRNRGDFCVWKFSKNPAARAEHHGYEEPSWKTPLGSGRPGWHIEDTAITEHFFGPQYDIHGGAVDLKFPHHEAEIAQQESASGKKPFVKVWMHAGFLTINGQKMSKSLGNFITIDDLLLRTRADAFRMLVFAHHYRSPMDFTDAGLAQAEKNLAEVLAFPAKLALVPKLGKKGVKRLDLGRYEEAFHVAMEDDFNTPVALGTLFELMNEGYAHLWELSPASAKEISRFVEKTLVSLGFSLARPKISREVRLLAQKREVFRRNKQFVQSDSLRKEIERLGYVIEDTPAGPFLWPRKLT